MAGEGFNKRLQLSRTKLEISALMAPIVFMVSMAHFHLRTSVYVERSVNKKTLFILIWWQTPIMLLLIWWGPKTHFPQDYFLAWKSTTAIRPFCYIIDPSDGAIHQRVMRSSFVWTPQKDSPHPLNSQWFLHQKMHWDYSCAYRYLLFCWEISWLPKGMGRSIQRSWPNSIDCTSCHMWSHRTREFLHSNLRSHSVVTALDQVKLG